MFGKKSNPTENLAQTLLDAMSEAMAAYRAKSPYDKTFFCTILGVNRKFVDDVPNTDKAELISKFSIPASLDEGEKNYYTIKINGAYYVKQSPFTFKLYENVNVRVPNGTWDNLYIEGNISENGNTFELPELYVSTDEPEGTEERPIKEHDYWAEIDDDNDKNLKSFYEYQNLGTSENPDFDWVVLYNIKEQEQSQRKIYVQETQPYNANKGDIWLKTVARRYDTNIVNIYERGNSSWALRGTFNNTGSSLQNGNEIYNDYTNNSITSSQFCTVVGERNWIDGSEYCFVGGKNVTLKKAKYSLVFTDGNAFGSLAGDNIYASLLFGDSPYVKGQCINSLIGGQTVEAKNIFNSIITGNNNIAGNYDGFFENKTGVVRGSLVIGSHNTVCCLKDGIVCGHGNQVVPEYDLNDPNLTLHGLIMGGRDGNCNSSGQIFIMGNGSGSTLNNALTLNRSGDLYIQGTLYQQGADYAETYEWLDGNPEGEDRTGLFVTLDGDKIVLADDKSDYILGAVSAAPTVCGDTYNENWKGKFERDIFGRILFDENGDMIVSKDFDPDRKYIPQSERPEKAFVGTHGKLIVIDDGTCMVNGYCKPSKRGIATASAEKTDYRVIERKDKNHIRIVIK